MASEVEVRPWRGQPPKARRVPTARSHRHENADVSFVDKKEENRMTHLRGIARQIIALFLAAAAPAVFAQQAPDQVTIRQTRKAVVTGLRTATIPWKGTKISNIKASKNLVEFNVDEATIFEKYGACWSTGKYQIDLRTLGALTTKSISKKSPIYELYLDGKELSDTLFNNNAFSIAFAGGFCGKHLNILGIFQFATAEQAKTFVDAMNRLSLFARNGSAEMVQEEAEWQDFQQKAAAWRALAVKPAVSDEVRQHRLLAEDALQQKQFDTAIAEYEEGLEIDPLWPQGHFNAAVLHGEIKEYEDAIWHMRSYLELLLNAPDAQDASDQILLWQGKLKQQAATPAAK